MPFIIPNATDTTGSNRYNALDQAEPDALDFQILGNRASGVISGCAVAAQTVSNYTVTVASGFVAINGVVYAVSSNPALTLPATPTETRFDLIVARLSGGSVSLVVVSGEESGSNPTFPPTPSRMTSTVGVPVNTWVNPDTDVVLAAIYRSGATTITNAFIVDKRVNVPLTTSLRGDIEPPAALGQNGDFYYKTSLSGPAGIYVKIDSEWVQLGISNSGGVPVGTVITWVSSTHPGVSEWLECDGSPVSRTGSYAGLYNVLGTIYGEGDGSTTFNLPNFEGVSLRGIDTFEVLGTAEGQDSVTLYTGNLPEHRHDALNLSVEYNGDHTHSTSGSAGTFVAGLILRSSLATTASGSLQVASTSTGGYTLGVGSTNTAGAHRHTVSGYTGYVGSSVPIDIVERHFPVRYFIKYA